MLQIGGIFKKILSLISALVLVIVSFFEVYYIVYAYYMIVSGKFIEVMIINIFIGYLIVLQILFTVLIYLTNRRA